MEAGSDILSDLPPAESSKTASFPLFIIEKFKEPELPPSKPWIPLSLLPSQSGIK